MPQEKPYEPCSTCRFWIRENEQVGHCHGGPPTAVMLIGQHPITGQQAQQIGGAWPPTGADEGCGAHKPMVSLAERLLAAAGS